MYIMRTEAINGREWITSRLARAAQKMCRHPDSAVAADILGGRATLPSFSAYDPLPRLARQRNQVQFSSLKQDEGFQVRRCSICGAVKINDGDWEALVCYDFPNPAAVR